MLFWHGAARAEASTDRPRVTVVAQSCLDVRAADVYHVVAVELDAQLVAPQQASPGTTRVTIRCQGTTADIVVLDPTTGKTLSRGIDLTRAPAPGRARLLALATVELISASWSELEAAPKAVPGRLGVSASPREQAAARSSAELREPWTPTARVGLSPYLAVPLSSAPLLAGGVLRISRARSGLGWVLDAAVTRGAATEPLGEVSLVTASAAAGLLLRGNWQAWSLVVAPMGRVGNTWWNGTARDANLVADHSFAAAFAAAGVGVGLDYAVSGRMSLNLHMSAEQVLMPVYVRSAGVRSHALEGTWIGIGLGSSIAL